MKKQLQGIAIILMSILLTIAYGNEWFFDLDFSWNLIFALLGIGGVIMTFMPFKNEK